MKSALLSMALLPLLAEFGTCGSRLIPYDKVYVSVETGLRADQKPSDSKLRVSVQMHRGSEDEVEPTDIDIDCFDFSADQRMMPEADLKAFLEVGKAAAAGEDARREVVTETFRGDVLTVYESAPAGEGRVIRMTRGKESAEFPPMEAERVQEAVAEATIGRAWFQKILAATELPEVTPDARPPRSDGYYMDSQIGEVSGRGISYEVTVSHYGMGGDHSYEINHGLLLYEDGQMTGSMSGGWVKALLQKITMALDAAKHGRDYSFTSGEDDGKRYTVKANFETKEADIVLNPGRFFGQRKPVTAQFSVARLDEIRRLIEQYESRREWFESNEGLFFTPLGKGG